MSTSNWCINLPWISRASGPAVSLRLALLKEACWYKNNAYLLCSHQSADHKIYHKATKCLCNRERNQSLESRVTRLRTLSIVVVELSPSLITLFCHNPAFCHLQEWAVAFESSLFLRPDLYISGVLQPPLCSVTFQHYNAWPQQHSGLLTCFTCLSTASPALFWGQWTKLLLVFTSGRRGRSWQLCMATCRGTCCSSSGVHTRSAPAEDH